MPARSQATSGGAHWQQRQLSLNVQLQRQVAVHRNDVADGHWIRIRPVGVPGNRGAGGAKIRVFSSGADRLLWYEQVAVYASQAAASYYGLVPTERHFGLGTREKVDVAVEFYPSGRTIWRKSVRANHVLVVKEEEEGCEHRAVKSTETRTCSRPLSVGLLAALVFAAWPSVPGGPRGDAYDAEFVRMTVANGVAAYEVFPVEITMRNAGTATWSGSSIRLRSVDRRDPLTWGTDYILIAQGTAVGPGDEVTFRSHLRAPAKAGEARFQWQMCKDGTSWFGDLTPARTIRIALRPTDERPDTGRTERTPDERRVLSFSDFAYIGSFKPPRTVADARGAFSESGLAVRPAANGRDRLLVNYTHPTQVLFELEVPELSVVEGGDHTGLETAEVKRVWGPLNISKPGEEAMHPNGGFAWIEETRTLIWTWYHGYKTGPAPPVLGMTRLSPDGRMAHSGPWTVEPPSGLYKSYWGGVVLLSRPFAERYTTGNRLALGFGGYYSICAPASRGPALGAIPEPSPTRASVPVTEMLVYPHDAPAPRDGNYFNANCGYWSEQPTGPDHGTWTYDDWCRAGVFIDTPNGHAYTVFARIATGRLGYDYGTITSVGESQYWYFYDPKDLGEAATGRRHPWESKPTSTAEVAYPLGRTVTGAAFDAKTHRLYLCASHAYPDGRESYPVIHVYRVQ